MVDFGEVRDFQGAENATKDTVESVMKGNGKKWNLEGNGKCKERNLQGSRTAIHFLPQLRSGKLLAYYIDKLKTRYPTPWCHVKCSHGMAKIPNVLSWWAQLAWIKDMNHIYILNKTFS